MPSVRHDRHPTRVVASRKIVGAVSQRQFLVVGPEAAVRSSPCVPDLDFRAEACWIGSARTQSWGVRDLSERDLGLSVPRCLVVVVLCCCCESRGRVKGKGMINASRLPASPTPRPRGAGAPPTPFPPLHPLPHPPTISNHPPRPGSPGPPQNETLGESNPLKEQRAKSKEHRPSPEPAIEMLGNTSAIGRRLSRSGSKLGMSKVSWQRQARSLASFSDQGGASTIKRGKTQRQLKHPEWRMPLITMRRGLEIVQNGIYNKGTAFTPSERERLGLRGLVPSKHLTWV